MQALGIELTAEEKRRAQSKAIEMKLLSERAKALDSRLPSYEEFTHLQVWNCWPFHTLISSDKHHSAFVLNDTFLLLG